MTKNRIYGMTADKASALWAEHDGQAFCYCSDHCRQGFLSMPTGAKPEDKSEGCCG